MIPASNLPIEELRHPFLQAIQKHDRIIIEAPTGSGKSTQLPQMLLEGGFLEQGKAVILQPRRLAARMLAARVAQEQEEALGKRVGYKIRFDEVSSSETRLLFVTEGILLRQMLQDRSLHDVAVLIFDEFHERHLYSDISLMQALELQKRERPDLKIIVMSATLDTEKLVDYLHPCHILRSTGKVFPVEVEHLKHHPKDEKSWDLVARKAPEVLRKTGGHLLIFMPGAYEIRKTIDALRATLSSEIPLFALHGELPPAAQDEAVASLQQQKVIVATNVAETSLTIEGVTAVIDTGVARVARFDPQRSMNTLLIEKISQASAAQRTGRAGRTAPGYCLRLWTEYDHRARLAQETPEIQRVDLAEVLLHFKATLLSGVTELSQLAWIDTPSAEAFTQAELLLHDLGALDDNGSITEIGEKMLLFPTHPRYARMLLAAAEFGCVRTIALMAAMTQARPLLLRADRRTEAARQELFGGGSSDFAVMARVFQWSKRQHFSHSASRRYGIHAEAARQVAKIWEQFLQIATTQGLPIEQEPPSEEAIARCLLLGFADHLAKRRSSATLLCDIVHGRRGMLSRQSAAAQEKNNSSLIVAAQLHEIGKGSGELKTELSMATTISEELLISIFPEEVTEKEQLFFDTISNRVVDKKEQQFRGLILQSRERPATPSLKASEVLAHGVLKEELPLPLWEKEAKPWLQRLKWLRYYYPEYDLPQIHTEEKAFILTHVFEGALSYREIKERSPLPALEAYLNPSQTAAMEQLAPNHYTLERKVPTSSQPQKSKQPPLQRCHRRLIYEAPTGEETSPRVLLRAFIQELFGMKQHPTLAEGRAPITLEILAPNHRPIQVTQDLSSFWNKVYPKIEPALARAYPKHEWPEKV